MGQNGWQGAASPFDAKAYKQSHGYQDGWIAIADPNWSGMDSAISNQTGTLPNLSVLDGDMKLVHAMTAWSWIPDADQALSQTAGTTP